MTASSFECFPLRVQLMGLPHSAAASTGSSSANTSSLVSHNHRSTAAAVPQRRPIDVRRNLFGSPEPGEIDRVLKEQNSRDQAHLLERFNIDIRSLKDERCLPTDDVAANPPATATTARMPWLIEQELKQNEERLQKKECNLLLEKRTACTETTPPNQKICNNSYNKAAGAANGLGAGAVVVQGKIVRRCCLDETISPSAAINCLQRQKPYSRQPLLTGRQYLFS